MRFFVTGIGGFVGPHLLAELLAHGHTVAGTSLSAIPMEGLEAGSTVAADLLDQPAMERALADARPDAVIHLAAQSNPSKSWSAPRETFETNVLGTIALIQACATLSRAPRVVVVSSADVYGYPLDGERLREDAPCAPLTPYGASKLASESCARLYGERLGVPVVIARPFSHTGPEQTLAYVVPSFARQVAMVEAGMAAEVAHGNLEAFRDFSDVRDIARGYRLLAEAEGLVGTYNLCSGTAVQIGDLLSRLIRLSGHSIPTRPDPARQRPEKCLRLAGDPTRARDAIGWKTELAIERTLSDVLEDQRAAIRRAEGGDKG